MARTRLSIGVVASLFCVALSLSVLTAHAHNAAASLRRISKNNALQPPTQQQVQIAPPQQQGASGGQAPAQTQGQQAPAQNASKPAEQQNKQGQSQGQAPAQSQGQAQNGTAPKAPQQQQRNGTNQTRPVQHKPHHSALNRTVPEPFQRAERQLTEQILQAGLTDPSIGGRVPQHDPTTQQGQKQNKSHHHGHNRHGNETFSELDKKLQKYIVKAFKEAEAHAQNQTLNDSRHHHHENTDPATHPVPLTSAPNLKLDKETGAVEPLAPKRLPTPANFTNFTMPTPQQMRKDVETDEYNDRIIRSARSYNEMLKAKKNETPETTTKTVIYQENVTIPVPYPSRDTLRNNESIDFDLYVTSHEHELDNTRKQTGNGSNTNTFPTPFALFTQFDVDESNTLNYKEFLNALTFVNNGYGIDRRRATYRVVLHTTKPSPYAVYITFLGPAGQRSSEKLLRGSVQKGTTIFRVDAEDVWFVTHVRVRLGEEADQDTTMVFDSLAVELHGRLTEAKGGPWKVRYAQHLALKPTDLTLSDSAEVQALGGDIDDEWTQKHYEKYQTAVAQFKAWLHQHAAQQRRHNEMMARRALNNGTVTIAQGDEPLGASQRSKQNASNQDAARFLESEGGGAPENDAVNWTALSLPRPVPVVSAFVGVGGQHAQQQGGSGPVPIRSSSLAGAAKSATGAPLDAAAQAKAAQEKAANDAYARRRAELEAEKRKDQQAFMASLQKQKAAEDESAAEARKFRVATEAAAEKNAESLLAHSTGAPPLTPEQQAAQDKQWRDDIIKNLPLATAAKQNQTNATNATTGPVDPMGKPFSNYGVPPPPTNRIPPTHRGDGTPLHMRQEHGVGVGWGGTDKKVQAVAGSPIPGEDDRLIKYDYFSRGADWNALCAEGKRQSPILIREGNARLSNGLLHPGDTQLVLNYKPVPVGTFVPKAGEEGKGSRGKKVPLELVMQHDGHSVRLLQSKSGVMGFVQSGWNSASYIVREVIFRAPSEHAIEPRGHPKDNPFKRSDKLADMEMQIVHTRNGTVGYEDTLIVSLLFVAGAQNNSFLDSIGWENLPQKPGQSSIIGSVVDLSKATLEDDWQSPYFSYIGSLTFPPCHENVKWHVIRNPFPIGYHQLQQINRLFSSNRGFAGGHGNSREIQDFNNRPGGLTVSVDL